MKYRQWFFVALSPLLLVVALVGVRSFGGSPDVASAHVSTGTVHIEIDMVKDGTTWCNPVDNAATHATGGTYEVAICLSDAAANAAPASFNIQLLYDDTRNSCADVANVGTGLDDNPDANGGSTTWGTSLGTGWDCSGAPGSNYPVCDKDTDTGPGQGQAFISCLSVVAPTLPVGAGVSSPIAVVTFSVIAGGVDNLEFGVVAIYRAGGSNVLRCPEQVDDTCFGATDTKQGGSVAPTATPTAIPTATSTPSCGGVEQPLCPTSTSTPKAWTKTPTPAPTDTPVPSEPGGPEQPPPPPPPPPTGGQLPEVLPPATGTGSGGADWATSLMWTLVGAGALSVFLGGLYLRRARNR